MLIRRGANVYDPCLNVRTQVKTDKAESHAYERRHSSGVLKICLVQSKINNILLYNYLPDKYTFSVRYW